MYSDAYNEARQKAESILKSSNLKVGDVIVVSEDVDFQQKMIDRIDSQWEVKTQANDLTEERNSSGMQIRGGYDFNRGYKVGKTRVDYTPKPLKIEQNISVMYEMQKNK